MLTLDRLCHLFVFHFHSSYFFRQETTTHFFEMILLCLIFCSVQWILIKLFFHLSLISWVDKEEFSFNRRIFLTKYKKISLNFNYGFTLLTWLPHSFIFIVVAILNFFVILEINKKTNNKSCAIIIVRLAHVFSIYLFLFVCVSNKKKIEKKFYAKNIKRVAIEKIKSVSKKRRRRSN